MHIGECGYLCALRSIGVCGELLWVQTLIKGTLTTYLCGHLCARARICTLRDKKIGNIFSGNFFLAGVSKKKSQKSDLGEFKGQHGSSE
jgi:hypothetical protein